MNGNQKHSIANCVAIDFFWVTIHLWISMVWLMMDWFPPLIWWQNLVLLNDKM
jgi:hypothetical protein